MVWQVRNQAKAFSSLHLHNHDLTSVCIDSLLNRSSSTPSYHRPQLTTLGGWHVQHSAMGRNNFESPRISDAHAIAEWHKSSNLILNHYSCRDNKHAWKVEDGETRGSGSEDRENECNGTIDPRFCELIDLGAPIRVILAIEKENKSKPKVEGKVLTVGPHRKQELKGYQTGLSDLFVLTTIGLEQFLAMTCLPLEQLKSHSNRRKMRRS
jgi:hypothetical protein